MKLIRCLLIASQAFVFVACAKSENLPERKKGNYCNITWELENVSVLGGAPSTARIDKEFTFSLNLAYHHNRNTDWTKEPTKTEDGELGEENIEYEIKPDNIHVYIGGENEKEYNESYNFYYIDNKNNQFVIKPQYMVNDVRIVIKATKREQPLALYGIEFSESLDKRIDYSEKHDDPTRDVTMEFRSVYQNKKVPIKILNHGQEAFPCYEHDELDVTLKVKDDMQSEGKELPDNIVIRTGAHYAILGIDFERDYYDNGFTCNIVVPTYVIHDHASVAVYGEK